MPPELNLASLRCRASIDYLSVLTSLKRPEIMPALKCVWKWHKAKGEKTQTLTLHDPSCKDIQKVVDAFENPLLRVLELAVDLKPAPGVPIVDRPEFLRETFIAVAARFRPEDMTPWGYGPRGGLTGRNQQPQPFHQRFPTPEEELIYGRRGAYMQSKLYLKRVDQQRDLPEAEHRVRMELTIRTGGLMEIDLRRLQDLLGYEFRSRFTKHFRIVAGPRLRLDHKFDEKERIKRVRRMERAWATAGVGKFAVATELPFETDGFARKQIKARAAKQLSREQFVLLRHQAANAEIGGAFKKLQRRMTR